MKSIVSEEYRILIAPMLLVVFMFFVPISASIKSVFLILFLLSVIITPYYRRLLPSIAKSIAVICGVLLFFYILTACFWSEAPLAMRFSVLEKYSKLLYLPFFAVAFVNPKTRKWTYNAFFAAIFVTCVLSFLKKYNVISLNAEDPGEVFYNHIATGYMIALAVYFAGVLIFQAEVSNVQRQFYLLIMIIGTYQIFFVNTGRTGYAIYGLLMTLLLVQKLCLKKALIGMVILATFMGTAYILSPVMQERVESLVSDIRFLQKNEENTSLGFRVQFHNYAKDLFEQHPIIGIGTGGFKYRYSVEQPIPTWGIELNDPHSQYWLSLTEGGIIGMFFYSCFLLALLYSSIQLKESRSIYLGMLVSFCIGSLSDTIFCYSPAGTLLIIVSALCLGELLEHHFFLKERKLVSVDQIGLAV